MLEILGVSKSGYYAWLNRKPSNRSIQKANVIEAIKKIYDDSKCIYGAPKITAELHKLGFKTAESTVTKYMREIGIKACWVKPYAVTTHSEDFSNRLKIFLSVTSLLNLLMLYGVQISHISIQEKASYISPVLWIYSPERSFHGNWHLHLKQNMLYLQFRKQYLAQAKNLQ